MSLRDKLLDLALSIALMEEKQEELSNRIVEKLRETLRLPIVIERPGEVIVKHEVKKPETVIVEEEDKELPVTLVEVEGYGVLKELLIKSQVDYILSLRVDGKTLLKELNWFKENARYLNEISYIEENNVKVLHVIDIKFRNYLNITCLPYAPRPQAKISYIAKIELIEGELKKPK